MSDDLRGDFFDSHCTQTQASKEDLSKIYIKLTTNRSLKTLSTDRDK